MPPGSDRHEHAAWFLVRENCAEAALLRYTGRLNQPSPGMAQSHGPDSDGTVRDANSQRCIWSRDAFSQDDSCKAKGEFTIDGATSWECACIVDRSAHVPCICHASRGISSREVWLMVSRFSSSG